MCNKVINVAPNMADPLLVLTKRDRSLKVVLHFRGFFEIFCSWMCLLEVEIWTFAIPIFVPIYYPSVHQFHQVWHACWEVRIPVVLPQLLNHSDVKNYLSRVVLTRYIYIYLLYPTPSFRILSRKCACASM